MLRHEKQQNTFNTRNGRIWTMTKRRVMAAGLPVAGMTVFAAALALAPQPAEAAPQVGYVMQGLPEVHALSLSAPDAVTTGNGGLLTGNQILAPLSLPITLTCNAVAVAGDAEAECPDGDGAGTGSGGYGSGGGRGNAGYGTPAPTYPSPDTPDTGGGTGDDDTGGGRGNDGYGGVGPTTPGPSITPTTPTSPSTGPACCGVSPAGNGGGDELPVTGFPLVAAAALGGLLVGGGAALRYAGRHRREN
jgi:hypothetical protein